MNIKIDKQKVLELYNQGEILSNIAKQINSSREDVKNVLLKLGIDYSKEFKEKLEAKKNKAKELYKSGIAQTVIEKELHMTRKDLRKILKEDSCISYREKSEQHLLRWGTEVDETSFDNLLNPDVQYWIGFLLADGHITDGKKEYSIQVGLQIDDIDHLQKFADFLKLNKLPHITKQGSCSLRIGSKKLWQKLVDLGFDNNKSYTARPPEQLKHSRDFWRGMVDGDGCLATINKEYGIYKMLNACGTEDTIEAFIDFVSDNLLIEKKESYKASGKILRQVSYYKEAFQIADLLYRDSKTYLDRKYKIYQNWIHNN